MENTDAKMLTELNVFEATRLLHGSDEAIRQVLKLNGHLPGEVLRLYLEEDLSAKTLKRDDVLYQIISGNIAAMWTAILLDEESEKLDRIRELWDDWFPETTERPKTRWFRKVVTSDEARYLRNARKLLVILEEHLERLRKAGEDQ